MAHGMISHDDNHGVRDVGVCISTPSFQISEDCSGGWLYGVVFRAGTNEDVEGREGFVGHILLTARASESLRHLGGVGAISACAYGSGLQAGPADPVQPHAFPSLFSGHAHEFNTVGEVMVSVAF